MISQVNSLAVRNAYAKNFPDTKESEKVALSVKKQGDTSKVEQIKEAIESGEYKINLQALSQKIAQELI